LDFDGIELMETTQAGFDYSKPDDLMGNKQLLAVAGQFGAITIGTALWKLRFISVKYQSFGLKLWQRSPYWWVRFASLAKAAKSSNLEANYYRRFRYN
jgi:hypothetical protein